MEVTPRYKLLLSKILGDSVTEWMDGVDTPLTVMTTRAPAVLKGTISNWHHPLKGVPLKV